MPGLHGTDGSDHELSLATVLGAVAEFGTASIGLVAWEYMVEQSAAEPAMIAAIRSGLLQASGIDIETGELLYELTPAGRDQAEALAA
jgi:hypothetical protein